MTVPRIAMRRRFSSASTAPPPVASTALSSAQSSAITCVSRARKPASPSMSKITGMRTPQRRSISSSASKKSRFRRRASKRPTVVFPAPIMPTRIRLPAGFTASFYADGKCVGIKQNGRENPAVRLCWKLASADGQALVHDSWRDEHQQLGLARGADRVLEQEPDVRQVAEERDARGVVAVALIVNAADHHRAAVLHQHLGLDVLGGDGDTRRRGRARLVLVDVERHDDVAVRRDLRLHLEREIRLAEGNAGRARRGRLLERNLRTLLDDRLDLVGRQHARARDRLALAVGLQRRDLHVEELGQGLVEQNEGELPSTEDVEAVGRKVYTQAVRNEHRGAALRPAARVPADIPEATAERVAQAVLAEHAMVAAQVVV